jgi:hypothetical protein
MAMLRAFPATTQLAVPATVLVEFGQWIIGKMPLWLNELTPELLMGGEHLRFS